MISISKHIGKQTVALQDPPIIIAGGSVVGPREARGPLRDRFDATCEDSYFGQDSWEKAEQAMLRQCFDTACSKAGIQPGALDYVFSGDLLNQCISSSFALRESEVPFFGLYGACSTMGEGLSLASMLIDGGYADKVCAMTGSHYCTAERQYRLPLEYGGQRTPTAQWTVTGAGALILAKSGPGPRVTHITTGKIVDAGIIDANNMGAAMAPAAYDTLKTHFEDTGRSPAYYDAVITGDLGYFGHEVLQDLFAGDGLDFNTIFKDCGMLIYDKAAQDVHSGGSGCGCSASVMAGHLLRCLQDGAWRRLLFAPTGALLSPTSSMQGDSIPGICHAIAIENMGGTK